MEALLGCDKDRLIFRVLETLSQVLIVAKAAGSGQQKPQDQDSWGRERNGGWGSVPCPTCLCLSSLAVWMSGSGKVRSVCPMCGYKHVFVVMSVSVLCGI